MTWTKLSDDFTDDPALLALTRPVRLVHIEAIVWSNRHGTDGRIPAAMLPRITDEKKPAAAAEQLVAAGKWKPAEAGWEIVGFLEDQPAADDVRRQKELARTRQRRQRQHRSGDHSLCDPRNCRAAETRDGTRDATRDVTRDKRRESRPPDPTRPDPTRPGGSGVGEEGKLADALRRECVICRRPFPAGAVLPDDQLCADCRGDS